MRRRRSNLAFATTERFRGFFNGPNLTRAPKLPKVVGVCDLGTFSGLILIARYERGRLTPLIEERHTVDLAYDSPATRRIPTRAVERAVRVIHRFERIATEHGCSRTVVVCTAAVRQAANRVHVTQSLRQSVGSPVVVISARREAKLTAHGALTGLPLRGQHVVVVDIGGGSTEIIDAESSRFLGLPVGAAWASDQWRGDLPRPRTLRAEYLQRQALSVTERIERFDFPAGGYLVGVGGTITTLAAINRRLDRFNAEDLHGLVLTRPWIAKMADQLASMNRREIANLIAFDRGRARVLTAGTYLWAAVLNRLGVDPVIVSVRGLRWGVARLLASGSPIR